MTVKTEYLQIKRKYEDHQPLVAKKNLGILEVEPFYIFEKKRLEHR